MTEATALTSLLEAEHAAIYGYGVLGARLDKPTRELALRAFDAHRVLRNTLTVTLRSKQLPTPAPLPTYDVTVADRLEAVRLAVRLEGELAVRWRDLVGATDDPALRKLAITALQETAVRDAGWRRTGRIAPLTNPFPGQA